MNSVVEELKEKIDIVDLVSQYVQLKKRGGSYFGLCPFHSEKTPSFSVNPKGQFFHCFGCGESGDAITFFMKIENIDFKDAIKELSDRYNVNIDYKENTKNPLLEIHKKAAKYFKEKLKQNQEVLKYLNNRKIPENIIDDFELGFAPNSAELYRILKNEFSEDDLIKSGIFVKTSNGVYNRFADRLIFPIKNTKGNIIAFGGRIIKQEQNKAKYINSPETSLFSKQKILYGLSSAKDFIRKEDKTIITEGYMDCIRLHSSGIKNAVATLGTALSKYHIATIKRYSENLYFNYDADEAGFRAMTRSAKDILSSKMFAYVISLTKGEDPDSFILKYGQQEYLNRISKAKDYFDYLIEYIKNKYDTSKPQNKLKAIEEIKPAIINISNPTIRASYILKASRLFNTSEDAFIQRHYSKDILTKNIKKEDAFLSFLLKDIELMGWIEDFDTFKDNLQGQHRALYEKIVSFYLTGNEFSLDKFLETINNQELKNLAYELVSIEHTDMDTRYEKRKVFLGLIGQFEQELIKNKLKKIKNRLKATPTDELLQEYNELFLKLKEIVS
jgi:DNA primase